MPFEPTPESIKETKKHTLALLRNFLITIIAIVGIFFLLTKTGTKYKIGECVIPTGAYLENTENLIFMEIKDYNRMQYSVIYYYKKGEDFRKSSQRYISRTGLEDNSYQEDCNQEIIKNAQ